MFLQVVIIALLNFKTVNYLSIWMNNTKPNVQFLLRRYIPVQMEGSDLGIVSLVVREVKMIGKGLLLPRESAIR